MKTIGNLVGKERNWIVTEIFLLLTFFTLICNRKKEKSFPLLYESLSILLDCWFFRAFAVHLLAISVIDTHHSPFFTCSIFVDLFCQKGRTLHTHLLINTTFFLLSLGLLFFTLAKMISSTFLTFFFFISFLFCPFR